MDLISVTKEVVSFSFFGDWLFPGVASPMGETIAGFLGEANRFGGDVLLVLFYLTGETCKFIWGGLAGEPKFRTGDETDSLEADVFKTFRRPVEELNLRFELLS